MRKHNNIKPQTRRLIDEQSYTAIEPPLFMALMFQKENKRGVLR